MNRKSLVAALVAAGGTSSVAFGALLGLNTQFPFLFYSTAQPTATNYTAATKVMSVTSSPIALFVTPGDPPRFVNPTAADPGGEVMQISIRVNPDGSLFGGVASEDLVVVGEVDLDGDSVIDAAGVLLTGEINEFGFQEDLQGSATAEFDFRFTCTGGALADLYFMDLDIGVVLTSESSSFTGSFAGDFNGQAKGNIFPTDQRGDQQGCTPGYWKQEHHFDSWPAEYGPDDLFEDVFGRDVPGDPTLAEALRLKGGELNALMRHTVAALLNAATDGVNAEAHFDTIGEVIAAFHAAFDSGVYEPTKDDLDDSNNNGCPLD